MTKLRLSTYKELHKVAEASGSKWIRRVGSLNTYRNGEGRVVVIPDHGSHEIVRPLLRKLIRDMGLSIEEYHSILDRI